MNAIKTNETFDCICPPLLKELFDSVIELDFISGQTTVCQCSENFILPDNFEFFDCESAYTRFLTLVADSEEQKMLLKIFQNIKADGVDYIYRRFTLKKMTDSKSCSDGYIVGIRSCCWICFNDRDSENDVFDSEDNGRKNILTFASRSESANDDLNRYISDLFFNTLIYFSQKEKKEAKKKQADGIRSAIERGVHFGRQKKDVPPGFYPLYLKYKNGEVSSRKCGEQLNVSHSTFLKWVRETDTSSWGE